MTDPTIELYYWPTPNGWKISIMLEECGLPYKVRYVDILKGDQFKTDFLHIAPNNRMPAIVDPDGPGSEPISVFESGAILQYLGNKTGKFYARDPRQQSAVEQWLYWQMANLGPMCGQAHHFRFYARDDISYATERYTNEVARLYGVMKTQLARTEYLAGDYSIADMACIGWIKPPKRQGQKLEDFPNLKRWFDAIMARPAVVAGMALGAEFRGRPEDLKTNDEAYQILFGGSKQG